ncbi:MAG: hypothetical protein QOD37_24 [Gaiellales bacterium]|nr:hypothetical protein [Gaiellales bacterium]
MEQRDRSDSRFAVHCLADDGEATVRHRVVSVPIPRLTASGLRPFNQAPHCQSPAAAPARRPLTGD